jgi:hypothetical protein
MMGFGLVNVRTVEQLRNWMLYNHKGWDHLFLRYADDCVEPDWDRVSVEEGKVLSSILDQEVDFVIKRRVLIGIVKERIKMPLRLALVYPLWSNGIKRTGPAMEINGEESVVPLRNAV